MSFHFPSVPFLRLFKHGYWLGSYTDKGETPPLLSPSLAVQLTGMLAECHQGPLIL